MQKTNINPEILQAMLDSAVNAGEKGQSQFFTPTAFGRALAHALPKVRPSIADLNCGNAQLLQASAQPETINLFGADIDPCHDTPKEKKEKEADKSPRIWVKKIIYDLTLLYPILEEADWRADCFVLNPPWRLFWHRERLAALAESDLSSVRDAFNNVELGIPKGSIDSTIATLLIALDRCTLYGEGMLIANNNTLERLLFRDGAPHAAVAKHVWLHLIIPGNPMTGIDDCQWKNEEQFNTGVIYFAREHNNGPLRIEGQPEDLAELRAHRMGAELRNGTLANPNQADLWQAARERVAEIEGAKPKLLYNLWLTAGGRIRTALSQFQKVSKKINKAEAARLHAIDGKAPMELVLQRADRDELLHVAERGGWRVEPALTNAITEAVRSYHSGRAPLYPLQKIQRMGYLDEQDAITCELDLPPFQKGLSYRLRTQTVSVTRKVDKPNPFTGENEELEFTGQQLAIFIADGPPGQDDLTEYCFMDATLKNDPKTTVTNAKQVKKRHSPMMPQGLGEPEVQAIDFTLQELCDHFTIPEVPDVAAVNPTGYDANLKLLEELEALCPA